MAWLVRRILGFERRDLCWLTFEVGGFAFVLLKHRCELGLAAMIDWGRGLGCLLFLVYISGPRHFTKK